jgi:hypothetical protein
VFESWKTAHRHMCMSRFFARIDTCVRFLALKGLQYRESHVCTRTRVCTYLHAVRCYTDTPLAVGKAISLRMKKTAAKNNYKAAARSMGIWPLFLGQPACSCMFVDELRSPSLGLSATSELSSNDH